MDPTLDIPDGYQDDTPSGLDAGHVFARHAGTHVVRVQTFGGAWGYTIWNGNRCVAGEKNWADWGLFDAVRHADEAMAAILTPAPVA